MRAAVGPSARRTKLATPPESGYREARAAKVPASGTESINTAVMASSDAGPAAAIANVGKNNIPVPRTAAI